MTEQNVEYLSLVQCTDDLTQLIQHNVVSVSSKLFTRGLVAKDVHDSILSAEGVANHSKAAKLLSCVMDRVKESAGRFQDFIDVLGEDTFFEDVMRKLIEAHKMLQHTDVLDNTLSPDDDKLNFPAMQGATPSHDGCLDSDETKQVGVQIKELEKSFTDLKKRLLAEMKANADITTEMLLESLTWSLPLELQTVYKPYLDEKLPTLEKLGTIREICSRLGLFFTFLDYHLLQYLVEEFGSKPLKQDMSAYAGKIQAFLNETTVQQVKDHLPGRHKLPPNFEKLQMVIDQNPGSYSLRMLDNLRKRFCSETQLSEIVFVLIGIGKTNSFLVVFMVPSILGPRLVESVGGVDDCFYQRECIISISLNQQQLYLSVALREKKMELEQRLLELCIDNIGDIQEFRYILSQPGVDPNVYDQSGWTPLCYISDDGRTEMAKLLLNYGAKVDLPTETEFASSPLILASREGHVDTCAVLIERGATVDYQNKEGTTALYIASQQGHKAVVELLLDRGASVDKPDTDKSTPLIVASEIGHEDVCQMLIQHGAEVNHQDKDGWSPLHSASAHGQPSIVELLIKSGAQLDIQTKDGVTALAWAAHQGHKQTVHILLNAGANPDIQNKESMTALMWATQRGHKVIVKELVERKANPNITADKTSGRTALHLASKGGHVEISRMLIEGGADTDIKDKNGLTAHDVASTNSHPAVCQLLERYGYWHLPTARYDPVTSLQTFRDILDHGSKLSDTPPKHQATHNAPGEYYDDTL